jgi:pilus assembly protein CpaC
MSPLSALAFLQRARRCAGSALALAATLSFVVETPLALAQTLPNDTLTSAPVPEKAKPKPKKVVSRYTATDNLSDDLNRRESERAAQVVQQMNGSASASSMAVAVPTATPTPLASSAVTAASPPVDTLPPTAPAIPPRAPVVTASLTPTVGGAQSNAPVPIPQVPVQQAPVQQAQTQPPVQSPAPVPIRPVPQAPAQATPVAPPPAVTGAPSRSFAQSQVVPTQQPTLTLEVSKGTALKLPGPAATVFVAAPDIADVQVKSPGLIYVFAKKAGDTVLYAVDDQDRVLLNTVVHVTSPLSRIKSALDAQYPGNGVQFDNQGETIVMSGTVRSALIAEDARRLALQNVTSAARVINNIHIDAPNQVQLRVKIAEVQRNSLKRMGINWQNINSIALFGIGPFRLGGATSTIQSIGGLNSSGAISATSNDGSLTSLVDLLATQGQANILAEPNLVAMSGETASFLAGGEIPVLSPQAGNGGNIITVTYKQIGVSLSFTPTIIGERINLKVAPEVSQVTTEGQVTVPVGTNSSIIIPAIATRRASTTVELGSGQSFAIGGLLQQNSTQNITKVPGLGDIPILGSLFKSDAYQRQETELVIIVTPYFVEGSSGPLRTPFTGRVPPTDADRIFYQRLNHPTPPATMSVSGGGQAAAGPTAGFKLD